jgi:hypothetical protein
MSLPYWVRTKEDREDWDRMQEADAEAERRRRSSLTDQERAQEDRRAAELEEQRQRAARADAFAGRCRSKAWVALAVAAACLASVVPLPILPAIAASLALLAGLLKALAQTRPPAGRRASAYQMAGRPILVLLLTTCWLVVYAAAAFLLLLVLTAGITAVGSLILIAYVVIAHDINSFAKFYAAVPAQSAVNLGFRLVFAASAVAAFRYLPSNLRTGKYASLKHHIASRLDGRKPATVLVAMVVLATALAIPAVAFAATHSLSWWPYDFSVQEYMRSESKA